MGPNSVRSIFQGVQTLVFIVMAFNCLSQENVYDKTMSYKQLVDEILDHDGKRLNYRNIKFELDEEGEDSIFFKTYQNSEQIAFYFYEIADYQFPASVVFFDCSFDDKIRFRECSFKNLEFVNCNLSQHFSFNICTFEGNLNFLGCEGENHRIAIDSSKFKRGFYIGSDTKFKTVYLGNSVLDTTIFRISPYKDKYKDFWLRGENPIPVRISSSNINFLEIKNCDFSIPNQDSITTISITEAIINDFNFLENDLKSTNFNYSSFTNSVYFENIKIQDDIIFESVNLPFYNTNISWEYLSGNKLCLDQQNNKLYKAQSDEELSDRVVFYDLISIYNKLYQVYKTRGDRESANGCYVEMKDIESRRLKYLYTQNPSLNRWFDWKLNQFLKFFCDYGTSPIKSLIISMYTILGFALIYFFFYSKWDRINLSFLIQKHKTLVNYFKSDQHLEDFLGRENKFKIQNYQAYKQDLEEIKSEIPSFVHLLGIPLYKMSRLKHKLLIWAYRRAEILGGKWIELKPKKKMSVGIISFIAILIYLLYILCLRALNSIVLSINTFSTLGFGDIPVKGVTRYVAIIEGFLGWFLLSIFSVSLISQILQT